MKQQFFLVIYCSLILFTSFVHTEQDFDPLEVISDAITVISDVISDTISDTVMDAFGVEGSKFSNLLPDTQEPCEFQCRSNKRPVARKNYRPSHNGCGSYGFQFDFDELNLYGFNECCNVHDVCYGTCNNLKINCDLDFKQCLLNRCKEIRYSRQAEKNKQTCEETANFMYKLSVQLGCPAYGSSQKEACVCK